MSYHTIGATGHQHTGLVETSINPFDTAELVEAQPSRIADSIFAYALMFWALASAGGLVGILCYCLMEDFGRGDLVAVSIAYVVGWGAVSMIFLYLTFAFDAVLASRRSDEAPCNG